MGRVAWGKSWLVVGGCAALLAPRASRGTFGARSPTALRGEATEISMPALSSTMTSGRVVSWLKGVGDKVEAGDAIMVVESDKADMEVESFEDGFLAAITVGEGEDAAVGSAIGWLVETAAEVSGFTPGGGGGGGAAAPSAAAPGSSDLATSVTMPALSSTMTTGRIVSWLKGVGDKVEAGDAIMVVESDKADMEVESFDEGYVAAILVPEGEESAVGAPVALLAPTPGDIAAVAAGGAPGGGGGAAAAVTAAPAAAPAVAAAPAAATSAAPAGGRVPASGYAKKAASEKGVDLATVAGTGPGGRVVGRDIAGATAGSAPAAKSSWTPTAGATTATPGAQRLAKSKGVDVSKIAGTGNFGRVTETDVKLALGNAPEVSPAAAFAAALAGAPVKKALPTGAVPMTGMQKAIAANMEKTLAVPVFRVTKAIKTDDFDALYAKLKKGGVTVSAMLAKACALALEKNPLMNAKYTPGAFTYNPDVNVAMAVALDGGLITPTLRKANEKPLADLSVEWKELIAKARAGSLKPEEFQTGTFTISNLGMFDVAAFDAILPPGQGAILAIGSSKATVVAMPGAVMGIGVEKQMLVTITCDHRIISGSDAAVFLNDLQKLIENPAALAKK